MSRGQFGEAEREFAMAVELAKAIGEDDPREALSLFNQAEALVAQARFDDAIPLFQRPWRSTRKPSVPTIRMWPRCWNTTPSPSARRAGSPWPKPPRNASVASTPDRLAGISEEWGVGSGESELKPGEARSMPALPEVSGLTAREIQDIFAARQPRGRPVRRPLLQDRAGPVWRGGHLPGPPRRGDASAGQGISGLALDELRVLIQSAIHEDRMLALLILVRRVLKADEPTRKSVYELYLANTRYVNNWDLVDASAREIVGGYLADKDREPLDRLAVSPSLWERRISIVATDYYIRSMTSPARCGSPNGCWPTART